jgi:hypothetical protein
MGSTMIARFLLAAPTFCRLIFFSHFTCIIALQRYDIFLIRARAKGIFNTPNKKLAQFTKNWARGMNILMIQLKS